MTMPTKTISRDTMIALVLGVSTALQTVRSPSVAYFLPQLGLFLYALARADLFKSFRATWDHFLLFLVYAVFCLLSVAWSDHQDLVVKTWRENFLVPGLFFLATCGIAMHADPEAWMRKYAATLIVTFFSASAVALAVNGSEAMRLRFETVGYYSTYVAILSAAAVPFLTPRTRVVFYVLAAAGLWWTQQRVAWAMFPLIVAADWVMNFRCRVTVKGVILVFGGILFSYVMMKTLMASKPADGFNPSYQATGFVDYLLSNERIVRWQQWAIRGMENPVLGVGYGRENALAHFSGGLPWPEERLYHAHNVLLNHFVQLGVVGLLIFVAAHVQMLRFFWRRSNHPAAQAGFLVIVFFVIRNLFDDFVYGRLLVVYAGVLGAMIGTLVKNDVPPQGTVRTEHS